MAMTNLWRFNQSNNLDGIGWMATNYNDNAWQSGRGLLAYETSSWITPLLGTTLLAPSAPPPGLSSGHAYYFRTTVVVTNDLTGYTLNARMRLDDCCVIYINGEEFSRPRMPDGVITNRSFGDGAVGSNLDADVDELFTIPTSRLHAGTNTIAVEVHQVDSSSSDIVWGMALDATLQFTNCAQSGLVLNEVLADNESFTNLAGRASDWIELFNASTNTIDLGDLSLSDEAGTPRKWVFPPGGTLAPGGRLVIACDSSAPLSATNTGFDLSAGGDTIYLFKSPAGGGGMLDSMAFGLQVADFSMGRIPDGVGPWALTLPTRDSANVPASLGNASALRINEWMANPASGDDWLELYNPNPLPADLGGLALTDDPARRNKSPFPPFSFIAPAGHAKLVADGRTGAAADHVGFGRRLARALLADRHANRRHLVWTADRRGFRGSLPGWGDELRRFPGHGIARRAELSPADECGDQ
jgi:hypothetical protein